jgi:protein-tyrosine phosphatase
MTMQLTWALACKFASKCVPFGHEATERVDDAEASQALRWLQPADVVFEDPDTGSTLSIGSSYNAAYLRHGDFDMVINCCPSEIRVTHPRVHELNLRDTNHVTLDGATMETLTQEIESVMALPNQHVLVHCWVGASRSVAVTAYVCCRLYGPTMDPVEDWDFFYKEFKKCRPSISVSTQLYGQVISLLKKALATDTDASEA